MKKTALARADDRAAPKLFQPLSGELETAGLALNYFECAPGEPVGFCYHRHHEQEELFVVLAGTATFETESGDVVVAEGEAIRFEPGEWQQGWNRGEDRLRVLALGAPREEGRLDLRRDCPACEERTPVVERATRDGVAFDCGVCGAETGRYRRVESFESEAGAVAFRNATRDA